MKKKILTTVVAILFILPMAVLFTACSHTHTYAKKWSETEHWEECECGDKINFAKHAFDNDCDTTCNGCDYVREITHSYDNVCDEICNVCGGLRVDAHSCGDDGICTICGETQITQGLCYVYDEATESYSVTDYGEVEVPNIRIPSTYDDGTNGVHPVKGISDSAFGGSSMVSIKLPETLTTIGNGAFWGCDELKSVSIPNSVTTLGRCAFCSCDGLESVKLSDSITSIEHLTFGHCLNLTSIIIPEGVVFLGSRAFTFCEKLESIVLPKSLTSIEKGILGSQSSACVIYFNGSSEEWSKISIEEQNIILNTATKYFYSESEPTEEGNFWRYVDGVPTVWARASVDAE